MLMDYEIIENVSWCLIGSYQRNMIVFVYRRRTVRELILTGGKVKTQGGGASAWLCGSSESKGVAILLSKHFAFDINFNLSDKTGRLLTCEINTENAVFHSFNIYAPNLCSDRKQFFVSFQNISYNHEDDSIYHYNIVLGDFNCILDKKIDIYPNRRTDDIGKIELQNLITRYDLYDAWRKLSLGVKFEYKGPAHV